MAAYLSLTPPVGEGKPVALDQVLTALTEAGVVYGLNLRQVEWAVAQVASPVPHRPVRDLQVAAGLAPASGQDATLEYLPQLLAPGGTPKLRPDGGVDLFDLGLVHNVTRGTRLAIRHPPVPGTPGVDVTGSEVSPRPVKGLRIGAGKGVVLSEDGLNADAAIDGHATLRDGKLSVSAVYVVQGDVATATGNVDFVGSVLIKGNIAAGFRVRAEQDVEVMGRIEGSVHAGGNVFVRYGIQGAGRGTVQVGGAIRARFIENATVRAGGDVTVADGILHSRVESGGRVEVLGRRGSIIGGTVRARDYVAAKVIGAPLATQTEICAGVSPELLEELEKVQRELQELEDNARRTRQATQLLKEQEAQGLLTEERRAILLKLVRGQYHQAAQREDLTARKVQGEARLKDCRHSWVKAQDVCYPGVRIAIGSQGYTVTDPIHRVLFHLNEQEEVAFGPA